MAWTDEINQLIWRRNRVNVTFAPSFVCIVTNRTLGKSVAWSILKEEYMRNFNPESPWNPSKSVEVSPEEYEIQVVEWLKSIDIAASNVTVCHLERIIGSGGEYEIDAVAKVCIFGEAEITVLVECKRYSRPVERKVILELHSKINDSGAHKGMIFSTSGFQEGALEYASTHGIATITFLDGKAKYETRSRGREELEPPSWISYPKYIGTVMKYEKGKIHSHSISTEHTQPLVEWLTDRINIA